MIVGEAGILSFGSFTLKDDKAHPCLHGSISSVQPVETRLHVFIYPQENLLIQHGVDESFTSVTYNGIVPSREETDSRGQVGGIEVLQKRTNL